MIPTTRPMRPPTSTPTTSGRTPGIDRQRRSRHRWPCRPGWAGRGPGRRRRRSRRRRAERERSDDPAGRDADREQDAGHRDREEEQDAVEDAPAHRAEDPLPDQQRRAPMTSRKTAKMTSARASAPSASDTADLAGDRRRFGLGQLDMGHDQDRAPHRGSPRAGRRRPGGLPRGCGGGAAGGGSPRRRAAAVGGVGRGSGRPGSCSGSRLAGAGVTRDDSSASDAAVRHDRLERATLAVDGRLRRPDAS